MSFFYSQSISAVKSKDGSKKKSFRLIKGKNDTIEEIKGMTTNNNYEIFDVNHDIKKKNIESGKIYSKHKAFKLKSSDMLSLFKEFTEHRNSRLNKNKEIKTISVNNDKKIEFNLKQHRSKIDPKKIKLLVVLRKKKSNNTSKNTLNDTSNDKSKEIIQKIAPKNKLTVVSEKNKKSVVPKNKLMVVSEKNKKSVAPKNKLMVVSEKNKKSIVPKKSKSSVVPKKSKSIDIPKKNKSSDVPKKLNQVTPLKKVKQSMSLKK